MVDWTRCWVEPGHASDCLALAFSTGQREFVSMLPLVSNDAVAILFMFDLTRKSTLNSVKEWYRQARGFNNVSRSRDQCLDSC